MPGSLPVRLLLRVRRTVLPVSVFPFISSMPLVISVRINPGATAFTVTCFLATSCASALVAAIIPPLAAE